MLADRHGNVIHLGERDCSIQRRHQKVIEESPAPEWVVDPQIRERIGQIGVDAARAVDYVGAGTIEGLFATHEGEPGEPEYFFLEMNTRVQVEHCVTEMTTGIDIVKEGIRAAAGEELSYAQDDVRAAGTRDRVPHQRRGRLQELRAGAGADRPLSRACRPGRAGRLGGRGRRGGLADVRPDGRQADRLGRRPRAGHRADAARARRIRDRGAEDADPLPPSAARDRAVGTRRDLQGPARGQEVAEDARVPRARRARRRRSPPRTSSSSRPTRSRSRAGASTSAWWGRRSLPRERRAPTAPRPPPRGWRHGAASARRAREAAPTPSLRLCRETCGRCSSSRATRSRRASCSASSRR